MKLTINQFKNLIKESVNNHLSSDDFSDDDVLDNTKPKFDNSPETLLLHKLFAAKLLRTKFAGKSSEEIAQMLGFVPEDNFEIVDIIDRLMKSLFYSS